MEKAKKYLEAKGGGVRLTVEELESLVARTAGWMCAKNE